MNPKWFVTACMTVALALTCSAAVAQDRTQDRSYQNDQNRTDRNDQNRNDRNDQNRQSYRQFNDKQRQYAHDYYNQHQDRFQNGNQWNDEYENRLKPGYRLDPDMRRMSRPAPPDMIRGMGPAPRGYHYVIIGGHVVLVDNAYRVHDAIHFDINIGH